MFEIQADTVFSVKQIESTRPCWFNNCPDKGKANIHATVDKTVTWHNVDTSGYSR